MNLRFQPGKGLPEHYSMHSLYHDKKIYKSLPVWAESTQPLASNERFTSRLWHHEHKDAIHSHKSSNASITKYYDNMMLASFNSHISSQSFQEGLSPEGTHHI